MRAFSLILFLLGFFLFGIVSVTTVEGVAVTEQSYNGTGILVATYGDGKLYQYGSLSVVVELHGNYLDMGRQYGALRKDFF